MSGLAEVLQCTITWKSVDGISIEFYHTDVSALNLCPQSASVET